MAEVHWPPMNEFAFKLHGYVVYLVFVYICFYEFYIINICTLDLDLVMTP